MDRDRDDAGRARSARPRDGLGRPLPHGAAGVRRLPEGVPRAPAATIDEAQRLLDDGLPFHAHEVFEDAWKAADDQRLRPLWQGLAQLAVGLTHAARGNPSGAVSLLRRGAANLVPYRGAPPHGLDVAGLCDWADELAAAIAGGGLPDAVAPPRLLARRPA